MKETATFSPVQMFRMSAVNLVGNLFPRKTILALLDGIKDGHLTVILPDGTKKEFGKSGDTLATEIKIKNEAFFLRLVKTWDIGLGEGYQADEIEISDITALIEIILRNKSRLPGIAGSKIQNGDVNVEANENLALHLKKKNTLKGSSENISFHYDLSNQLYQLFLDPTLAYSSAIFKSPNDTLEQAQINKFEQLCSQLELKSSDHLLEIGTGWGGFDIYAANKYQCKITTVTISKEQYHLAQKRVEEEKLQHLIEIKLKDYRELLTEKGPLFDKAVSIEMFEAVGYEFYGEYFKTVSNLLKPSGLFAMQVISFPDASFREYLKSTDWIQKHIFPGSILPSVTELARAAQVGDFVIQKLENYDLHYAKTLKLWRENFLHKLKEVKALNFDDKFIRTWIYYLSYCEAAFKTRHIGLLQVLFTRPDNTLFEGNKV